MTDGNIFNSRGAHVATVKNSKVYDLNGKIIYTLRGVNIYRLSGELVGHLADANAPRKLLNQKTDKLFDDPN